MKALTSVVLGAVWAALLANNSALAGAITGGGGTGTNTTIDTTVDQNLGLVANETVANATVSFNGGASVGTYNYTQFQPFGNGLSNASLIGSDLGASQSGITHFDFSSIFAGASGTLTENSQNFFASFGDPGANFTFTAGDPPGLIGLIANFNPLNASAMTEAVFDAGIVGSEPGMTLFVTNGPSVSASKNITVNLGSITTTVTTSTGDGNTVTDNVTTDYFGVVNQTNWDLDASGTALTVPEPGTLALFGAGLLGLLGFGVMRRRASS